MTKQGGLLNTRILVAIVFGLSASIVRSQNAELSDKQVAIEWLQLSLISSGDTDSASMEHLKSHGFDDDAAAALTRYMKDAESEYKLLAASFRIKLCANQQALRDGGQEALAQFIEVHSAEETALQRAQVRGAEALLSDVNRVRLHNLLDNLSHGPRVHLEESNDKSVANLARTGQITVDDAIKRSDCGSIVEAQK